MVETDDPTMPTAVLEELLVQLAEMRARRTDPALTADSSRALLHRIAWELIPAPVLA